MLISNKLLQVMLVCFSVLSLLNRPESLMSCQSLAHLWLNVSWQFDVSFVKSIWRSPECDVWAFSASSPMVKTPPQSTEPQDSAEDASCGQESLPVRDTPAPKSDPDAWIQVEKRHRQTKVKLWRIKLYLYFSLSFLISCLVLCFSSILWSPVIYCCLSVCIYPSSSSLLVLTCMFSAPLPP